MIEELIQLGMILAHHLSLNLVDNLLVMEAKFIFGDLSRHGITINGPNDTQVKNWSIRRD